MKTPIAFCMLSKLIGKRLYRCDNHGVIEEKFVKKVKFEHTIDSRNGVFFISDRDNDYYKLDLWFESKYAALKNLQANMKIKSEDLEKRIIKESIAEIKNIPPY